MKKRMLKTLLFLMSVSALMCIMIFSASAKTVTYKDFKFDVTSKGATLIQYNGKDTSVSIPKEVKGVAVKAIGLEAFWCNKTMKSISIPSSVTSIGIAAFNECTALKKVVIPSKVTSIGESAFWYCTNLKTVVVPKSVKTIGKNAFKGCGSLTVYVTKDSYAEKYIKNGTDAKLGYRYISKLKLASSTLKLAAGTTQTLSYTVSPSVVYNKKVSYSSSNKKVATVDSSGKIKAIGCGSAVITVKTKDGSGITKKCTVTVVPGKVTSLSQSKTSETGYTLKWKKVEGAARYKIFRYNSKTKKWDSLATTDKLYYTVKGLTMGTTDKYKVRAYTKINKTTYLGAISSAFTAKTVYPGNVTKLTAKPSRVSVSLTWAKADNATGYRVYTYNSATKKYTYKLTTKKLSAKIKDLKPGTKYTFAVRSYAVSKGKTVMSEKYSSLLTCTTRPDYVKSFAVNADATTESSVTLKWTALKGASGYRISMWDATAKAFKTLKTLSGESKTAYTVENLKAENTYKFTIKAYIKVGSSNLYGYNCDEISVKTNKAPLSGEDAFKSFIKAYNESKTSKASFMLLDETSYENVKAADKEKYESVFSAVFKQSKSIYTFTDGTENKLKKPVTALVTPTNSLTAISFKDINTDSVSFYEDGMGHSIEFTIKSESVPTTLNDKLVPTIDWVKVAEANPDFSLTKCTYEGTAVKAKIQDGKISLVNFTIPVTVEFKINETPYSISGSIVHKYAYIW